MIIVRVNGQDVTHTAVGQEFARDFHDHGGRGDVQPNGDVVITITDSQYMRAINRQVDRDLASTNRMARQFASDARAMLGSARTEGARGNHAAAPASGRVAPKTSNDGPLTADDLNELGRISDGVYDNFGWLDGVR